MCTWGGSHPIAKMEWYLQGLNSIPLVSTSNSRAVIVYLDQSTLGLGATTFICRATDTEGDTYEEDATVQVKGNECGTSACKKMLSCFCFQL